MNSNDCMSLFTYGSGLERWCLWVPPLGKDLFSLRNGGSCRWMRTQGWGMLQMKGFSNVWARLCRSFTSWSFRFSTSWFCWCQACRRTADKVKQRVKTIPLGFDKMLFWVQRCAMEVVFHNFQGPPGACTEEVRGGHERVLQNRGKTFRAEWYNIWYRTRVYGYHHKPPFLNHPMVDG